MKRLTPAELSTLAARRPTEDHFEEVCAAVAPLVRKYSRRYVQGFDEDDISQEMLLVLFSCHRAYDPTKGSFLNLCIRSMQNMMGKLQAKARRNQPITGLQCRECSTLIERRARGPECECGGRRWDPVRLSYGHVSVESIVSADVSEDNHSRGYVRFMGEIDESYDSVDRVDLVQRVLAGDSELQDIAAQVLAGGDGASSADKDRLREALTLAMGV